MKTTCKSNWDTAAIVVAVHTIGQATDDDRPCVELSETTMQYETANRNSDHGWIDGVPINHVTRSATGRIQYHFDGKHDQFRVGQHVQIKLDSEWRHLQMRLACAARVIELAGPLVCPGLEPIGTDYRFHYNKVEFGASEFIPDPATVWPDFHSQIERLIALDLPVRTTAANGGAFRSVQIGDFPHFRCAAPYPASLLEIGKLSITQIQSVGGRLQVCYRVGA